MGIYMACGLGLLCLPFGNELDKIRFPKARFLCWD